MPVPSPVKITKDGIEFISKVDRAKYTLQELSRAALRDVGKLLRKRIVTELKKLPGMKKAKRPYKSTQYWVRKKDTDLQIGIRHDTWYGVDQELGTKNQPKREILRKTVFSHLDDIRRIEGAYLKEIEDENRALGLIDEEVETEDDEA